MQDDDHGPEGPSGLPAVVGRVERLVRGCLPYTGLEGGGVALVTERGHRATVCSTDAVSQRIEDLQFSLGEGPCIDASSHRSPVLVADLFDPREGVQDRWPLFLDAAAAEGVRAVFAFPVRIGAVALGAMDLYRTRTGALDDAQLAAALRTADTVALALLDVAGLDGPLVPREGDRAGYRLGVHRAAGMVMVQLGSTMEDALVQLRALAFAQDRSIDQVADDVVARRLRFPQEGA